MMPTNLTLLERKISNNLNCLYFVNHPVYRIQKDHQLALASEYSLAGNVTEIICDEQQRYHILFVARKEIVLTEKKVAKVTNNQGRIPFNFWRRWDTSFPLRSRPVY